MPTKALVKKKKDAIVCIPSQLKGSPECLMRADILFCLGRLSRHYLPPVAVSGEKEESEVRTSRAVQKR